MSNLIDINDSNFDEIVLKSKTPVLIDFWAPWCTPCKMVTPVVEELSNEYEGKVTFGNVNVDETPKIAVKYGIMSIPTLIIFKNGQPVSNIVGYRPKDQIKQSLDAALSA